jgi:ubiquinone/menaquinone biosynthesis C-methylase UbiE
VNDVPSPQSTFAGSVPETYDRFMGPIFFEPYADDLVARLPATPRLRVLELACGTGIVTRRLRDRLPDARILATDLSEAMIAQARLKFTPAEEIEWRQADATSLPLGDQAFDAVVCQFGVMFFPDKPAGFREAYRVLAPGGLVLFNVWDALERNQLSLAVHEALAALFPTDPPDFYDIPFGFHDPLTISGLLQEAGFEDVQITTVQKPGICQSANDAALALVQGTPVRGQIVARPGVDLAAVTSAAAATIRERFGDDPVRSTLSALVCAGRRPER